MISNITILISNDLSLSNLTWLHFKSD